MAATKNRRQLTAAGTTVAANASVAAGEWNISTAYLGSRMVVRITNGASAPTTAPTVKFFAGGVTGEKVLVWTASGDTVANSVTDLTFVSEQGDMFLNATVTGGATNGCTFEAFGLEATGL
jgi:hypothetical protein